MKYGVVNVGDTVKFNKKAHQEIKSAIDDKSHIVGSIDKYSDGTEVVNFTDDEGGADAHWLTRIRKANKTKL